jgi:hypothetical protein
VENEEEKEEGEEEEEGEDEEEDEEMQRRWSACHQILPPTERRWLFGA